MHLTIVAIVMAVRKSRKDQTEIVGQCSFVLADACCLSTVVHVFEWGCGTGHSNADVITHVTTSAPAKKWKVWLCISIIENGLEQAKRFTALLTMKVGSPSWSFMFLTDPVMSQIHIHLFSFFLFFFKKLQYVYFKCMTF